MGVWRSKVNKMRRAKSILAGVAVIAASLMLSGCDPDEQDSVLRYEKGTYLGKPDSPLEDAELEALRARARNQSML
jgi:hypothetical protein